MEEIDEGTLNRLNQRLDEAIDNSCTLWDYEVHNRVLNRLIPRGIKYLGQLVIQKREDISKIKGLGKKSLSLLDRVLQSQGLSFSMNIDYTPPEDY